MNHQSNPTKILYSVQASIEGIVGELLDTKNDRDLEFIDRKNQNSQYDEAKKIIIAKNSSKKRRISFKQNPIEYCEFINNIWILLIGSQVAT